MAITIYKLIDLTRLINVDEWIACR